MSKTAEDTPKSYTPFWKAYFDRKTQRHDGTPDLVIRVFNDWHDGTRTSMYRFLQREAVSASKLVSEISKAMGENNDGEKEAERLRLVRIWAIRESQLADATQTLKQEFGAFMDAAFELPEELRDELILEATKFEPRERES